MTENLIDESLNTALNSPKGINRYSLLTQILIWLFVFLGCFIFAQLISGVLIVSYYDSADMKYIASKVYDLNVLRLAQMMASAISFLLPALLFSKLKENSLITYSTANVGFHPLLIVLVPLLIISVYPMINITFYVNEWLGLDEILKSSQSEYKMLVDALLKDSSVVVLVLNIFTVALLPALAEEWMFRGTLQRLLTEKVNLHAAVFFSALAFSLVHMEFSGFVPRIALGMFLGYLFYYSGSLWTSIYAHAVNNGAQVMLMYLNNRGIYKMDLDDPEMPKLWEIIVYTIAFVFLWFIFKRIAQKGKNSTFV